MLRGIPQYYFLKADTTDGNEADHEPMLEVMSGHLRGTVVVSVGIHGTQGGAV